MCITDKEFKPLSLAVCLGVQQRAWEIICWWWSYVPPPKQHVAQNISDCWFLGMDLKNALQGFGTMDSFFVTVKYSDLILHPIVTRVIFI